MQRSPDESLATWATPVPPLATFAEGPPLLFRKPALTAGERERLWAELGWRRLTCIDGMGDNLWPCPRGPVLQPQGQGADER